MRYEIRLHAETEFEVEDGKDPREYIEENWEKITEEARRNMLDIGDYELYEVKVIGNDEILSCL